MNDQGGPVSNSLEITEITTSKSNNNVDDDDNDDGIGRRSSSSNTEPLIANTGCWV